MRNLELCEQVAYTIEFGPHEHETSIWIYVDPERRFTTRVCLAGLVCLVAGDRALPPPGLDAQEDDGWLTTWVLPASTSDDWLEADRVQVRDRAKALLEISDDVATELFHPVNTKTRSIYLLRQLADGVPEDKINWHLGGYVRADFPDNAVGASVEG